MKSFKILSIFLSLLVLLGCMTVPAAAVSDPVISAPTALVLDRHSGCAVYEKNAEARIYPASTTKIMTALLAVEAVERGETDPDTAYTVPAEAMEGLSELGSSAGIRAGEELTLRQLLYCAMLPSANEAGNIIAFCLAGGIAPFTERMNARAAALSCTGTHFANAHGLPNQDHYTTAADMGRIALEALRHPLFAEICATAEIELPATNLSGARQLRNSNPLLSDGGIYGDGFLYDGCVGVKTGHTTAAGYCLVSAAGRGGVDLLTLVFGAADAATCFRDSITLNDWAFANHSYREINAASDCIRTVPVLDGDAVDYVDLCPVQDFILLLPNDIDLSACSREVTVYGLSEGNMLTGPIAPGAVLGRLQLLRDGENIGGVDLVPASSSAVIMDRRTGEIVYSKGIDNRVYPADTTKLMTGLLAVEAVEAGKISMNDMVTVTEAKDIDLTEGSTLCGLEAGEQMTLMSLLQCALIASADDAANMVADYVAGSVPDFVAQMNARAADLGCEETSFTNVHGAYDAGHYTTARDFCRIAAECLRHERLTRICGTEIAELAETNLSGGRTLRNTNPLICDESPYGPEYVYEDADGLKSGYNERAGYSIAATASRNGIDLLCVIFGGVKEEEAEKVDYSSFSGAVTLFDWVFDNYADQEVLKSTENIASVDVALGMNSTYVNLRPATSITVLLPKDFNIDDFEKDIQVYALQNGEPVTAPVAAGQVLGEVTLKRDGRSYGTVKLVASASVELSRMQYIRQQVRETTRQRSFRLAVAVLAGLFLLYLIWVVIYRVKRLRYRYAVRAAEREREMLAESAMKHAPEPKSPGIRFFDERGVTSAPVHQSERNPQESGDKVVSLFPAQSGNTPKEDDLLAQAVLVARAEPPAVYTESAAEKAERDYFTEFFRPKN